jgi:hypothetical protein
MPGASVRHNAFAQGVTRCPDGNQGFYVKTFNNGAAADEPFAFAVP